MKINGGTLQDLVDKTKRGFGLNPNNTKPFLVTSWKKQVCNYEGEDIRKCIDLNNLGKLRQGDRACLDVKWGPDYEYQQTNTLKPATAVTTNDSEATEVEGGVENVSLIQGYPPEALPAVFPTPPRQLPPGETPPAPVLPSFQPPSAPPTVSDQLQALQATGASPPVLMSWCNPNLTADPGRLTALEARAAQWNLVSLPSMP